MNITEKNKTVIDYWNSLDIDFRKKFLKALEEDKLITRYESKCFEANWEELPIKVRGIILLIEENEDITLKAYGGKSK